MPIAGAICLGAGILFGLPALRLEGPHLALATFALAVATPQILKFKGFDQWTGGVQGIQVEAPAASFGLPLNTDRWIYYFSLIWTIALFIIARNLLRGRTGRAIIAIRDHPLAAAAIPFLANAGAVWVNRSDIFDPNLPWGCFKQSGWGRELGQEGVEAFTELKALTIKL